jgi:hypothetical protein
MTQVPVHPCVARLQAWFAGQSVVVLQPHTPAMHWLLPEHGPQAAPFVPHSELDVAVMQVPVASQQPLGQLVGVHFGPHVPPVQVSVEPHTAQPTPFNPQLVSEDVSHCPLVEQQPPGQLVGVHPTLASVVPVSGEPVSGPSAPSPPAPSVPMVASDPAAASPPVVASGVAAPSVVASCPPSPPALPS